MFHQKMTENVKNYNLFLKKKMTENEKKYDRKSFFQNNESRLKICFIKK